MQQRTKEWYDARLGIPTASRFYDIVAQTKTGYSYKRKDYAIQLALERITGIPTEMYVTKEMQDGIDTEPVAVLEFEIATGIITEESGFIKKNGYGASPDRLINIDTVLEIKCPKPITHFSYILSCKVPINYFYQLQGQMLCTERSKGIFASYCGLFPDNKKLLIIEVPRDESIIKKLEWELAAFENEINQMVRLING